MAVPINEKMFDDSGFVLLDGNEPPPPRPATTSVLLARLGVRRKSRPEQESAITQWLIDHEPGKSLTMSLHNRGFGHLLKDH